MGVRLAWRIAVLVLSLGGLVASDSVAAVASAATVAVSSRPAALEIYSYRTGSDYLINADGSGFAALPAGIAFASSPDGRYIAYIAEAGSPPSESLVVRGLDGRARRLPLGTTGTIAGPVWSADGKRIELAEGGTANEPLVIRVYDLAGRMRRSVTLPPGTSRPDWSPDGSRLLFYSDAADVFVAHGDGTHPYLLGTNLSAASWSPDNRYVAFDDATDRSLWAADVSTLPAQFRQIEESPASGLSWSPDGRRVVFSARDQDSSGAARISVFVANPDGTGRRRILDGFNAPAWSPAGTEIAVMGPGYGDHPNPGLFVVRPDGTGLRKLLRFSSDSTAVWSPDGRAVAVAAGDIWVASLDGQRARRITEGWRYGYASRLINWLPVAALRRLLPATPVSPALPSDSVVQENVLRTTRRITRLAADGAQVAIAYARSAVSSASQGCLETWKPLTGALTRFVPFDCEPPTSCCSLGAQGFVDLGLSGDRLAWTTFYHFAGLDIFDLLTATNTFPRPVLVRSVCPDNSYGDCLFPEGHFVTDGTDLFFSAWQEGCPRPSYPTGCALAHGGFNGTLWRLDGTRPTEITSGPGPLTPLSADGGRILADHEDGTLDILAYNGSVIHSFSYDPSDYHGAELQSQDLLVFQDQAALDYDAQTGTLVQQWPLSCQNATLAGLQTGIAAYTCGDQVRLLKLNDGMDIALPQPGSQPRLQLDAAGLFISYTVQDADHPGLLTFTPFNQLPLH